MHIPDGRTATRVVPHARRDEFVAAVEGVLPQVATRLEGAALYAMVAAFWGLVLYVALTSGLQ